jgi:hypothetical protein
MAIINDDGHFNGPLGNYRFYSLNGKNVVATKGGPTAKQIKTKASYSFTRAHNAEFGLISKVSSAIFRFHQHTKPFRHPQAYQALRSHLFRLLHHDVTNQHGKRSLLFSEAHQHFDHMQISALPYTQHVALPVEWSRTSHDEIHFHTKAIPVKSAFIFPNNYNQVHWSLYIQGVKNIDFNHERKAYFFEVHDHILPLTQVTSVQFSKHDEPKVLHFSAAVNKDYNYLVFAGASFIPLPRSKEPVKHMFGCIGVIGNL